MGDRHYTARSCAPAGRTSMVILIRFLGVVTTYPGLLACRFFLGLLEGEFRKETSIMWLIFFNKVEFFLDSYFICRSFTLVND